MPYQENPSFKTPCRSKPLWRYMHIDKFIAMLNSKKLYFPNVYSYNDEYEGKLSEKSLDEIRKISLLDENNTLLDDDEAFFRTRKALRDPLKKLESGELASEQEKMESGRIFEQLLWNFLSHLMYCNSWFQKKKESNSMWGEYGEKSPTSVAIQTTVGDLIDSLDSDEYKIHIGEVKYKDYKEDHIQGYENITPEVFSKPDEVLNYFTRPSCTKEIYMRTNTKSGQLFLLRMFVKTFWGVSTRLKYHFIATQYLGLMFQYCENTKTL